MGSSTWLQPFANADPVRYLDMAHAVASLSPYGRETWIEFLALRSGLAYSNHCGPLGSESTDGNSLTVCLSDKNLKRWMCLAEIHQRAGGKNLNKNSGAEKDPGWLGARGHGGRQMSLRRQVRSAYRGVSMLAAEIILPEVQVLNT